MIKLEKTGEKSTEKKLPRYIATDGTTFLKSDGGRYTYYEGFSSKKAALEHASPLVANYSAPAVYRREEDGRWALILPAYRDESLSAEEGARLLRNGED